MRCGVRKSKTFLTEPEAREWVEREEARVFRRYQRHEAARESGLASAMPRRVLDAIAATDYTAEELSAHAVPYETSCGVYFLMLKGDVVYVGQSIDVLGRIAKHRREGKVFDAFNFIPCERARALALEAQYITALLPALNSSFGALIDSPSPQWR
jgi:hypothetical protein